MLMIIFLFLKFGLFRGEDEAGGFTQNLEIVAESEREIIAR